MIEAVEHIDGTKLAGSLPGSASSFMNEAKEVGRCLYDQIMRYRLTIALLTISLAPLPVLAQDQQPSATRTTKTIDLCVSDGKLECLPGHGDNVAEPAFVSGTPTAPPPPAPAPAFGTKCAATPAVLGLANVVVYAFRRGRRR